MRPATTSGAVTSSRRRGVQLVTGTAVVGGLWSAAAPWWAWAVLLSGLLVLATGLRRLSPTELLTKCSA